MEFCPVCMLRKGLGGGSESGESSTADALEPKPVEPAQRFDHYELVTGEGGKAVELGRGAMGVTYRGKRKAEVLCSLASTTYRKPTGCS